MWLCRRYHTEKCSRRVATCLDNQPYHLVTEDSDREAMGWEPKYRANRYSQVGVVSLAFNLTGPVEDRWMKIKYPVPAISSSIMTLEVAADSLTFIQNYSPGQVCTFAEILLDPRLCCTLCCMDACIASIVFFHTMLSHDDRLTDTATEIFQFLVLFLICFCISNCRPRACLSDTVGKGMQFRHDGM